MWHEFLVAILGGRNHDVLANDDRMNQVFSSSKTFEILSASIGIVQSDDPTIDIDLMIQQSDIALYRAKANGRSCYCFYDTLH